MGRKFGINGQRIPQPVLAPQKAIPDAAMDHYWHPDREGVEQAPQAFRDELALISPDVCVVRPPGNAPLVYTQAWLVWYRKPTMTFYLSPGWLMLREWRTNAGEPLPLDARVFSFLYSVSARKFGNGKRYWDHCVSEMQRDRAAREKVHTDGTHDRVGDYFEYTKIKNIGAGNKFALHHDGTVTPGRGQANWLKERRARMIPGDVARDEAQQREARG